jgi:hypothetical protein
MARRLSTCRISESSRIRSESAADTWALAGAAMSNNDSTAVQTVKPLMIPPMR